MEEIWLIMIEYKDILIPVLKEIANGSLHPLAYIMYIIIFLLFFLNEVRKTKKETKESSKSIKELSESARNLKETTAKLNTTIIEFGHYKELTNISISELQKTTEKHSEKIEKIEEEIQYAKGIEAGKLFPKS